MEITAGTKKYKDFLHSDRLYPLLFLLGFLTVLVMHLYKAPLEIQGSDEVFYLTIPKRLLDGDALLVDEWHGSQLSALLLLPFVWLHKLIWGYEGIVLRFRYLYVAVHALCALVVYFRLRSHKLFGVLASLFFFLFTPYDIMALDYDSMGIMLMTLTGVLLATAKSKKVYCVSGLLFAGAVLCCPYLLLAYAFASLAVWLFCWKTKNTFPVKAWGLFTLGAILLAIPVLGFILSRASVQEILNALPAIFSDPSHPGRSLPYLAYYYILSFMCTYTTYIAIINGLAWLVYIITVILALTDRNRVHRRVNYLLISVAVSLILLINTFPYLLKNSYHFIMLPLVCVGLMSYIVTEKRKHPVFLFLFCGGLLYTFCIHLASNQARYIIPAASTVVNVGSILLLGDALREIAADRCVSSQRGIWKAQILPGTIAMLFVVQFSFMGYVRINHKYWSSTENRLLTDVIPEGPYAGIHVESETREKYMKDLTLVRLLAEKQGTVLYAEPRPWFYLVTPNLRVGAYTSWVAGGIEHLATYYKINPDKLPDYIYLTSHSSKDMDGFRQQILEPYGFHEESLPGAENSGATLYSR